MLDAIISHYDTFRKTARRSLFAPSFFAFPLLILSLKQISMEKGRRLRNKGK
jgi:hypothetical protein